MNAWKSASTAITPAVDSIPHPAAQNPDPTQNPDPALDDHDADIYSLNQLTARPVGISPIAIHMHQMR